VVRFCVGMFRGDMWGLGVVSVFFALFFRFPPVESRAELMRDIFSVNTFHNLTHEPPPLPWETAPSPFALNQNPPDTDTDTDIDAERILQSRAFQIGSIGFADATGILLASVIAVPVEVGLCRMQVKRGKGICAGL